MHNMEYETTKYKEQTLISQTQIAKKVGISQGQLSRIFGGETYGPTSAKKIGNFIGVKWNKVFAMEPLDIFHALAKKIEASKDIEAQNG